MSAETPLPSAGAERALLDSESRLRQVLDNTSALVFAKDRHGRYLFVNREFERVTGQSARDIVGRTDDMVFPAELAARFRHNDLRVLREIQSIEFEEAADFGSGLRTFLSSKFPLLDADGKAYAVCGIATDITERKRAVDALRDSEAQYRAIFNASEDALILWDSRYRRVDVNPAFHRIYGWSREEVIGRTYEHGAFGPDYVSTRQDMVRRSLAGETVRKELESVRKDGEHIRTEVVTIPFRHRGEPHVLAIARDITDRKRIEEALAAAALAVSQSEDETLYRELARYLATTLSADAALIATIDPADPARLQMQAFYLDGEVRENFAYPMHGTPCETVVGSGYRFYGAQLRERFPVDLDFAKLGFESYAGYPLCGSQGESLGLISVVSRQPLENPGFVESVLRIFAVRVNAELARASAEQALRASETSYRQIFEASDDAIFIHDWDTGAILDVNPKACETYGYAREELLRLGAGDLSQGTPPYSAADARNWIERAKREGSARFEWWRRNKDGTLRWDEVRLTRARIGGQPRVLAITRDITDRKAAEEKRARLEAQLRQAQKMEAIGQLTGGIAHDFNNLLTSIMGYVALAAERDTALADERLGSYLAQARKSCERARDLIQQMLTFSRGQRGSPRAVSLAAIVRDSAATLRAGLPGTLELAVEVDAAVPPVHVDPVQVEQVLLNLCINARDAVGGSGRVRVGVRALRAEALVCEGCRAPVDGEFVELAVEDDGCGIAPELIEHIFEPFFSTKAAGEGSGMGLAMVHGIVHEHGGHVLVRSRVGSGTRFSVLWPALSASAAAVESRDPELPPPKPVRPALAGSVLVVDDEESVGEFMRELLGSWGLDAQFAPAPEAALEALRAAPARFDVVITDHAMPRMSGLELAGHLKAIRPELPVILYTGYGDGLAGEALEAARLCAVLRKPVDPELLAQTLARCVGIRERR